LASDLDFGVITPGAAASVLPGGPPAGGQTLGALQVDHNSDVMVSAVVPAALLHTVSGNALPVSFSCGYSTSATGALLGSASACDALGAIAHPDDGSPATTYLQVGGSIAGTD